MGGGGSRGGRVGWSPVALEAGGAAGSLKVRHVKAENSRLLPSSRPGEDTSRDLRHADIGETSDHGDYYTYP